MREQLIRYLLGELDTEERRELRAQLRADPELQKELDQLRTCFAANQEDEFDSLPGNLAERTADRISNSDEYELEAIASGRGRMSESGDAPAGVLGWSLADLAVAFGVMLAVSMLVFPALRDSRDSTRRVACENNMVELYVLVSRHAQDFGGRYPTARPNEKVGVFAAQLIKHGYIDPNRLAILLVCPASEIASKIRSGEIAIHLPGREEIRTMTPIELSDAVAGASPCYGYRMGHYMGNDYVDPLEQPTTRLNFNPLFADIGGDLQNGSKSPHRGSIRQFMNYDGKLKTFAGDVPPAITGDADLFHNKLGVVAAGIGPDDVVLALGNAMPGLQPLWQER